MTTRGIPPPDWLIAATAGRTRFPRLRGTEKQCAWAAAIRHRLFEIPMTTECRSILLAIRDATWFLANRDARSVADLKWPTRDQVAPEEQAP